MLRNYNPKFKLKHVSNNNPLHSLYENHLLDGVTASEIDDNNFYSNIKNNNYYTRVTRGSDAWYDIKLIFKKGEECEVYLSDTDFKVSVFTRDHPLFVISMMGGKELFFRSKNRPLELHYESIRFQNNIRQFLYMSDFKMINPYFTTEFKNNFVSFQPVADVPMLHILAKRIQIWWKMYYHAKKFKYENN